MTFNCAKCEISITAKKFDPFCVICPICGGPAKQEPIPDMKLIVVGVNTLTSVDHDVYSNHCQFWYRLGRQYPNYRFILNHPHRMSIDRMRNMTAKIAIDHNADYLMFIDDDVIVPLDAVDRLIAANADIAAGHTIIRGYPFNNMFFKKRDDGNLTYDNEPFINERGLIDCEAVGFSCVLIKTSLLRKVPSPWFITGSHNTEDVYFCLKARQVAGVSENHPEPDPVSIVVDPCVKTMHCLGTEYISPDNVKLWREFVEAQNPEIKKEPTPTENVMAETKIPAPDEFTYENLIEKEVCD